MVQSVPGIGLGGSVSRAIGFVRLVLLAGLLAMVGVAPAQARMYQWTNPGTGLSQLSGVPPSWYRSARSGPRVLVFERGVLVDDTSLPVSAELAQSLRDRAFADVERQKELAALQRLEEAAKREAEKMERLSRPRPTRPQRVAVETEPKDDEPKLGSLEQFGSETIDRLKAIIAEFDRLSGTCLLYTSPSPRD